jgi:site-specific DNA-methyltransferase (cytosine-N4-specific)
MDGSNVNLDELGVAQESEATKPLKIGYRMKSGRMYRGTVEQLLASRSGHNLRGKVNLIFTSPPFPLNRKKKYGNLAGQKYLDWIKGLAPQLVDLLTEDGSIVIELGNAWEPGKPVMSVLPMETLLGFMRAGDLNLCQEFVCHNPAKLPTPAQWVNIDRIRVKDSYTHVWWMSLSENPKADNRKVLSEYSPAMEKLLKRGTYNSGRRPSGHNISKDAFFTNNGGAIPPNVLTISNTSSTDPYRKYCRALGFEAHPAPMQAPLIRFFIEMLTDEGDLVFDPFAGSNSTGAIAHESERKWVSIEPRDDYVEASKGRFAKYRNEAGLNLTDQEDQTDQMELYRSRSAN